MRQWAKELHKKRENHFKMPKADFFVFFTSQETGKSFLKIRFKKSQFHDQNFDTVHCPCIMHIKLKFSFKDAEDLFLSLTSTDYSWNFYAIIKI